MKRILISTFGTRGDIQPYIALGQGLQQAGYEVALCTVEGFRGFVEEHGVRYAYMANEILELTQAALGNINGVGDVLRISRQMTPAIRRSMDDEWEAARSFAPDLILHHPKCMASYHIAEKLGIPLVLSLPLPFYTPTRAFPIPFFANFWLSGWTNRLSYGFVKLASAMYAATVNDFRQKSLNLPRVGRFADLQKDIHGNPIPIIYPYSPSLLPVPEDFPPHVHVPGYWFLARRADWEPDPSLVRFLEAGDPSVYIGFGSMGDKRTTHRTQAAVEALAATGLRGVLATGWGGLQARELPPNVFMLDSVPHDWLFPQVAAVVHHGGAGTTAAGLRAGKPALICPFLGDQPFWGKIVARAGVGPAPIPQRRLTGERLAAALARMTQDAAMQNEAASVGQAIRAEDGVGRAVEILAGLVGR